MWGVQTFCEA